MKKFNLQSSLLLLGVCMLGIFLVSPSKPTINTSPSLSNAAQGTNTVEIVSSSVCSKKETSRTCKSCNKAEVKTQLETCETLTNEVEDINCSDFCPKCTQDEEVSRTCTSCNTATIIYKNKDCSEATRTITDSTCKTGCSVVNLPAPAPIVQTPQFGCNCNKTCPQMISCAEAYYQLNNCGCSKRDGDNDGIPCEDIC